MPPRRACRLFSLQFLHSLPLSAKGATSQQLAAAAATRVAVLSSASPLSPPGPGQPFEARAPRSLLLVAAGRPGPRAAAAGAAVRRERFCSSSSSSTRQLSSTQAAASAAGRLHMGLRAPPPPSPSSRPITSSEISSQRTAQIAFHLLGPAVRPFSSASSSSASQSSASTNTANMASQYTLRKVAAPNTFEHRVYIEKDGVPVSPFHDIPLYANQEKTILNMIVEIPRWTNAKLEVRISPIRRSRHQNSRPFTRTCLWLAGCGRAAPHHSHVATLHALHPPFRPRRPGNMLTKLLDH